MHTMQIRYWLAHHDGDFSGDVILSEPASKRQLTVPFAVLAEIVAEAVRRHRIEELEQSDASTLLGLRIAMMPDANRDPGD